MSSDSSLLHYGTSHSLLDMTVLYDLPLYYNLFDDKIHNHLLILLSFHYGSLNTAMADVNLTIQILLNRDQMLMVTIRLHYDTLNILSIILPHCDLDLLQCCMNLYDSLNKPMLFRHTRSDDNLHNLLLNVILLMENLMLRD